MITALDIQLERDHVVTIDQSGTEDYGSQVSVYEPAAGELRWRVPVPWAPHFVVGTEAGVAVPDGTGVRQLGWQAGAELWHDDHGSPGQGGQYSNRGQVEALAYDESEDVILAAVRAAQPHRD